MRIRNVNLADAQEIGKVKNFLKAHFDLGFDEDTEFTIVMERENKIVATASYAGNIIKQVAIHEEIRGSGQSSHLIETIINRMLEQGILHLFVYTSPKNKRIFTGLGFKEVAGIHPHVVLLEWGNKSIQEYTQQLKENRVFENGNIGALVMNCNPFTLGHQFLVETASRDCDGVYLFVLEEDQSAFPFEIRLELVRKAVEHLKNVVVLPSGQYIISQATFPAYFSHKKDLLRIQTELDAEIFGRYLATALSINRRLVGNEPYCDVTDQYNQSLKKVMPRHGIALVEVERKKIGNQVISAKTVREAIRLNRWENVGKMVPKTTYDFLRSDRARSIIETIKTRETRH